MSETSTEWVRSNFALFERDLNGSKQSEFHALRQRAFESFLQQGIPDATHEEWRYTNVSAASKGGFTLAPRGAVIDASEVAKYAICEQVQARLVFVDGVFNAALSTLNEKEGIIIEPLSDLLSSHSTRPEESAVVQGRLAALAPSHEHAFVALNTAFVRDGVYIRVKRGIAVDLPIEILTLTSEKIKDQMTTPRALIIAEEGSSVSVIESFVGLSDERYLTCAVSEIVTEQNAEVDHYRIGREGREAVHMGGVHARVGRDARFRTHFFTFGGKTVRNEGLLNLEGQASHSVINGLSVMNGEQHVDNYTVLRHAEPHCESNERFKGIYAEKSRGAFQGTIIVEQIAQKTNAIQSNQSLLLSTDASVDTKPQLKIWADDVKCTHGATVGQLDADALFYLRTRGLSEHAAKAILTEAFAGEILTEVRIPELKNMLRGMILQKLGADHE